MSFSVILIEMAVFSAFFTALVFIDCIKGKNTVAGTHNYPPDIQEEYFKTHDRVEVGYKSKR